MAGQARACTVAAQSLATQKTIHLLWADPQLLTDVAQHTLRWDLLAPEECQHFVKVPKLPISKVINADRSGGATDRNLCHQFF